MITFVVHLPDKYGIQRCDLPEFVGQERNEKCQTLVSPKLSPSNFAGRSHVTEDWQSEFLEWTLGLDDPLQDGNDPVERSIFLA